MNANQISEQVSAESALNGGANPLASAVLKNFFSKKPSMNDEKISENVSEKAAEQGSEGRNGSAGF